MFCTHCGTQYDETETICAHCGAPLPQQIPIHQEEPMPAKGRVWVPFLVLVIILAFGIGVYWLSQPGADALIYAPNPAFSLTNGILKYVPSLDATGGAPTVPARISTAQVTCIPEGCFADCITLRGIKLSNGLERIEARAFRDCGNLEAVYLPASISYIDPNAFDGCSHLRHVFYCGSLAQWETQFGDILPKNCQLHIVIGAEEKDFYTP